MVYPFIYGVQYKGLHYFDTYPDNENIGLSLSGGADSALLLYLFAKMVSDRTFYGIKPVQIHCLHGHDISYVHQQSSDAATRVVEYVQNKYPNVSIFLHITQYHLTDDTSKEVYHREFYDAMKELWDLPHIVRGTTQGMPESYRPSHMYEHTIPNADPSPEELIEFSQTTPVVPLGAVDKRWVKLQYRYQGIMDLANITASCIADIPDAPCRECWWCKERFWAFGNYDGGIQ
jgi:7-cyano-7-deazaguanine synthase in queuosine biosynthesis